MSSRMAETESDGLAGRIPANTAAPYDAATPLRPSDPVGVQAPSWPIRSVAREEWLAKNRARYKGRAVADLPPSMQPKICVSCGGSRSFSSVAYCGPCYRENSKQIQRDVKARRKLFRAEKDRTVYRYRAPMMADFEAAKSVADLLAMRPASGLAKGTEWLSPERRALCLLVGGDADISRAAIVLGRSASALAWKAREIGLQLPEDWRGYVTYGPTPKREDLAFPYIAKARPEHADLLRVNTLVPRSFPEWQRADICQSIMLALFEGKTTLGELEAHKDKPRYFIKEYYKKQQPWQEVFGIGNEDDERSYEDIAARIGHNSLPMRRFVEPTQIEDAFQDQIARHQRREHARSRSLEHGGHGHRVD